MALMSMRGGNWPKIIIIIYLPRTHTTQRARRTNSIWQVRQGWSTAL